MPKENNQAVFDENRAGTGTREWSDESINICTGCDHGCRYCFAMFSARRFGRIKKITDWPTMIVNQHMIDGAAKKFDGVVMFPTTHDITPSVLPACLQTLHNLLSNGNRVLIVSKPHLSVIKILCREIAQYRDQIQFRFTIGSLSPETCKLWEPGAPSPLERIEALKYAYSHKFSTSVSMEPMLGDNAEMCRLVATVESLRHRYRSWLGKLNRGVTSKGMTQTDAARLEAAKKTVRQGQSDENILAPVSALKNNPKVRWKDSIKEVMP